MFNISLEKRNTDSWNGWKIKYTNDISSSLLPHPLPPFLALHTVIYYTVLFISFLIFGVCRIMNNFDVIFEIVIVYLLGKEITDITTARTSYDSIQSYLRATQSTCIELSLEVHMGEL